MRNKLCVFVGVASLALFVSSGVASALTLGSARPIPASPSPCTTSTSSEVVAQFTDDPSTPYHIPTGGGTITQWQMNTSIDPSDAAGQQVTFAVLSGPAADGVTYTVVGADTETLPSPLPLNGIASFTLSSPITVAAGDTLAIYSPSSEVVCYFDNGAVPSADSLMQLSDSSFPVSTGQTLTKTADTTGTGYGWTANLQATLIQPQDAAVTTGVSVGGAAGQLALLSSTVTNNGSATQPITFTDSVPSGLTVDSAAAGGGVCSTSGQTVTCTVSGLSAGQSEPVDVLVTPSAAGIYTNAVSVGVSSGTTDPNLANNSASATLSVSPAPAGPSSVGPSGQTPHCVVPKLKGLSGSFAKIVLKDLGCKVKVKHKHSRVHKGDVIGTSPRAGTYAHGTTVTLKVSLGKKKKH
jgi:hypothetical protein